MTITTTKMKFKRALGLEAAEFSLSARGNLGFPSVAAFKNNSDFVLRVQLPKTEF